MREWRIYRKTRNGWTQSLYGFNNIHHLLKVYWDRKQIVFHQARKNYK